MYMFEGDYAAARAMLEESATKGNPGRILLGQSLGALCLILQGQMGEAESLLRGVLQTARQHGVADLGVVCVASALLGEVLYESNDLEAVRELLEPRIELLLRASIPDAVSRALLVLCTACWLQGRHLDALDHLDRLEDYATRHSLDRPLAYALALRLRSLLRRGDTVQAQATVDRMIVLNARQAGRASAAAAEIGRMTERARAEMSLHWNDFDAAIDRLVRVLADAEAAGRTRSVAGLRAQIACAEASRGNDTAAHRQMTEALRLGHRLGLTRSLLDVSRKVPELLEGMLQREGLDPVLAFYARRVLAASAQWRQREAAPSAHPPAASVIASFSEREREVLHLVAQALPNKKIARVLGVTPHTVKWHLRKIYAKLGVAERDEAVARLRDLELGRENTGAAGSTN
jgi:LuxR family maltose regulon positive regulatory protein